MDLQVYADLLLTGVMDDAGLDGAAGADGGNGFIGADALGVNPIGINAEGSPITKDQMIQSLLAYCHQDTLAMVELVKWLKSQK